jgi:hypothetical protein
MTSRVLKYGSPRLVMCPSITGHAIVLSCGQLNFPTLLSGQEVQRVGRHKFEGDDSATDRARVGGGYGGAGALLKSSPVLAQRLQAAEAELARLEAAQRAAPPALVVPNVGKHYLGMLDRLDAVLLRDPERGREELRGILGEKIKLQPDESGRFVWAEYSLGLTALLPNAEIMVAGACYLLIYQLCA